MRETGRCHLSVAWLKQALSFYNRIMRRGVDDVVRRSLVEDTQMAEEGQKLSWAFQLGKCMQRVGCEDVATTLWQGEQCMVDGAVRALRDAQERNAWSELPESPAPHAGQSAVRSVEDRQRDGFKLLTYAKWFAPMPDDIPGYIYCLHDRQRIMALARFRMVSHSLGVETGRWGTIMNGRKQYIPRSQRCCHMCNSGERDDEAHVWTCQAYGALRSSCFRGTVLPLAPSAEQDVDSAFHCLMNGGWVEESDRPVFWNRLAKFLVEMNCLRSGFLDSGDGRTPPRIPPH